MSPQPQQKADLNHDGAPPGAPFCVWGLGRGIAEEGLPGGGREIGGVQTVEITRTLVKSPPELWAELEQEGLAGALGGAAVRPTEPERELSFKTDGASGTVRLEPSSWGTKVVVSAEIEEQVAARGFFARLRSGRPVAHDHDDLEQRLHGLLDALGQARRKPFTRG